MRVVHFEQPAFCINTKYQSEFVKLLTAARECRINDN